MREIISTIQKWQQAGKKMALATVLRAEGSSPRPVGSKMIVSEKGEMMGSISGGCVESSVIEEALVCLEDHKIRIQHYGIDNSNPWTVGLACGGQIDVFIEPLFDPQLPNGFSSEILTASINLLEKDTPFSLCLVLSPPMQGARAILQNNQCITGESNSEWVNRLCKAHFTNDLAETHPQIVELEPVDDGTIKVFIEPIHPQPRMIIIGAVHIAVSLTMFANVLDYKTIIIDPRKAFLTRDRFPKADELVNRWPQDILPSMNISPRDCVIVLSHDEKIDVPALKEAITSSAGYIGMLGSKKTKAARFESLTNLGIPIDKLQKVHAPIGLNIGAVEPQEIAASIMAEIIASRRGLINGGND